MADHLNRYFRRMKSSGKDVGDAYKNNTIAMINATFHASPTYRVMKIISSRGKDTNIPEIEGRVIGIDRLGSLREIILRPLESLEIGTYAVFDDDTWLIIDKHGGSGSTGIKMLSIRTNEVLRWIDRENKINEFKCVASATDLGSKSKQSKNEIEWNKYDVRLPQGQLFVSVELNDKTEEIGLNDRFIFGRNVYEVTGIDDMTLTENGHGVIQFTVKITTKRSEDDFDKNIAFNDYTTSGEGEEDDDEGDTRPW